MDGLIQDRHPSHRSLLQKTSGILSRFIQAVFNAVLQVPPTLIAKKVLLTIFARKIIINVTCGKKETTPTSLPCHFSVSSSLPFSPSLPPPHPASGADFKFSKVSHSEAERLKVHKYLYYNIMVVYFHPLFLVEELVHLWDKCCRLKWALMDRILSQKELNSSDRV